MRGLPSSAADRAPMLPPRSCASLEHLNRVVAREGAFAACNYNSDAQGVRSYKRAVHGHTQLRTGTTAERPCHGSSGWACRAELVAPVVAGSRCRLHIPTGCQALLVVALVQAANRHRHARLHESSEVGAPALHLPAHQRQQATENNRECVMTSAGQGCKMNCTYGILLAGVPQGLLPKGARRSQHQAVACQAHQSLNRVGSGRSSKPPTSRMPCGACKGGGVHQ